MDAYTFLDIESVSEIESRVPEVTVEITRLPTNPTMGQDVCRICYIIKQIQVGRTIMLCG